MDRMVVASDTVTVTAAPAAGGVTVSAAFEMRPTGPEIKEAVVGIVGVSEVSPVWRGAGPPTAPLTPGLWSLGLPQAPRGWGRACGAVCESRVSGLRLETHARSFPFSLSLLSQVGGGHFLADPLPGEAAKPAQPAAARTQGAIPIKVTYTIAGDGSVRADWAIDATDALPAPLPWGFKSLPRVGVHLALTADGSDADPPVAWYGSGPHESYPDRKDSAPVRAHAVPKASDLHVPYLFPGECGGRADVRWLAVGSVGLASLGESPLQANVSRFPLASFSGAGHDEELVADGSLHVHLDAGHMGVGGDDSWSPAVWEVREDGEGEEEKGGRAARESTLTHHSLFLFIRNTRSRPRRTSCRSCWCRPRMGWARRPPRRTAGWRGVEKKNGERRYKRGARVCVSLLCGRWGVRQGGPVGRERERETMWVNGPGWRGKRVRAVEFFVGAGRHSSHQNLSSGSAHPPATATPPTPPPCDSGR